MTMTSTTLSLGILLLLITYSTATHVYQQVLEGRTEHAEVTGYNYGIFRISMRDGSKYEVQDVIVATDNHNIPPSGETFNHNHLNTVVRQSSLVVKNNGKAVEFHVDSQVAIAAELSAPNGEEVGATVTFPGAAELYGIPERAVDLALKDNTKYRLYNLDIFKYELDNTQGLYGVIPLLMAHSQSRTVGFLWLNAADSSCQIDPEGDGKKTTWTSESGIVDMFFLPGPTPLDVQRQYSYLTGKQYLPPLFSLGYHQCRWNYRSEEDVLQVDDGFDTHDIPYDVIWLDIEHTDGKRYFTWDSHNFPTPEKMQDSIAAKGRKMVTITDPHIKRAPGYHVFDEASSRGYFVKNSAGTGDYEGHCWPGTSSWLDFTNPEVREWYATLFKYDRYKGSTPILYSWIDMNEPSVFQSHEVTMDKNAVHHGGVKHRDVHNMYGYYHNMAAHLGHLVRSQGPPHDTPTRPFILSRSFYAGTQRYCAVWTGDNMAEWSHLGKSTPMLLSLSLSGLVFVGADVGGFFGNPETELLVRWYQQAALTPFFRGHAHLETKRREPWLFGDENTALIRTAIRMRYKLLPFMYTLFYMASQEGTSVIFPLFFQWPDEPALFTTQDQFMLGQAVMAQTISEVAKTHSEVLLPGSQPWYEFRSGQQHPPGRSTIACSLQEGIPMFQLGGTIVPLRERARRSSTAQINDPFTLQIALDSNREARGNLYVDDTHSFKYQQGAFVHRQFTFSQNKLTSAPFNTVTPYTTKQADASEAFTTKTTVERIRVFGLTAQPKRVTLQYNLQGASFDAQGFSGVVPADHTAPVELTFNFENNVLTVRKPQAAIALDWTITFA